MTSLTAPRFLSRPLPGSHTPTGLLRLLRREPGLVALLGAWHDGHDLIAYAPAHTLGPTDDPFDDVVVPCVEGDGFGGGWIGIWGHQLGAHVERLPAPPPRPAKQPDFHLAYYDHLLRHGPEGWRFEALVTPEREAFIEAQLVRATELLLAVVPKPRQVEMGVFAMRPPADDHRTAVSRTLRHIEAGDIFQANVCTRLETTFTGDPLDVFCRGVEALTPAYAAFVRTDDGAVASLSPELFLRRQGDKVLTSPIKGTASLDTDVTTLLDSAKDRAENIMIVDLMRNDLGRVCQPGSIAATHLARAERHSVWHLVSDVAGTLRPDVDDAALLRATFPPGSVTGAPKVRALEIIAEVEATGREAYTGAIGYVSPRAGLELNVVIRTFEFAGGRVWLGVGGGVVADSTPDCELIECLVKARPLLAAIGGRLDPALEIQPQPAHGPAPRPSRATGAPRVSPDRGQGTYDTLLVVDGGVIEADAHRTRLAESLDDNATMDRLWDRIEKTAHLLEGRHRLRVDLVPGREPAITHTPLPVGDSPWTLVPRVIPGGWGSRKWRDHGALGVTGIDRAVLVVDADGTVLETGRSSVFAVRDDGVYTPPLDGRILPGIARARVLSLLRDAGIPTYERPVSVAELATASEVFVTNSLRGVLPVIGCEEVGEWPSGRTTAWVARLLEESWAGRPHRTTLPPRRAPAGSTVLLIDNYDSFVYNLAQLFGELGAETEVVRNDAVSVDELLERHRDGAFTHLVVSPGPGTPAEAGISCEAIRRLGPLVPTLGVCLGHQCAAVAFGGRIAAAPSIVHGKASLIHHDGRGAYAGLDGPLVAARYHSLVVDSDALPATLEISAQTAAGVVMGIRHRMHPVEGVQMHPESILTPHGRALLGGFMSSVG